jgi:alanyl-tRNA synthetase
MDKIGAQTTLDTFVEPILAYYKDSYPETVAKTAEIRKEIQAEEERFRKTLEHGLKKFDKWYRMSDVVVVNDGENALKISEEQLKMKPKQLSGEAAFDLFTTHGFPLELTIEEAKHRGMTVDVDDFKTRFIAHENLSRAGSEQKFKGGLGDTSEISLKYHTATHLLHQALRMVLGTHVGQKGSNITPERLRFDFTHNAKMTDEEKRKVEDIVNEQIKKALPVQKVMLPKAEAEKTGALHFFGDKYGDIVSVYFIGNSMETAFSKEFCGGPHVENIGTLGTFKIQKEEAVSAGVRRIKAVLS